MTPSPVRKDWLASIRRWAERVGLARKLAVALAVAAVAAGLATYAAVSEGGPEVDPKLVVILLNLDVAILLMLGVLIAHKIVQLWGARRRGSAGSKLHVRLVMMFCGVAAVPTVLVGGFSVLFLNLGIQGWFSEPIRAAVEESLNVAEAYLSEHQQAIQGDILAMAKDINRQSGAAAANPRYLERLLTAQASIRNLPEAVVVDSSGRVIAASVYNIILDRTQENISEEVFQRAREGNVVVDAINTSDMFRALVRLDSLIDAYLYVGRYVDPLVIGRIERARNAADIYSNLEGERERIEVTFAMVFALIAVLLLMAAVMMALTLAARMAQPISALIAGSEKVRDGDLTTRLEEIDSSDEISALTRSFNRMTGQLEQQRRELIEANRQLDERRRFSEAVLAGASAGILGLDRTGRLYLANSVASELLQRDLDGMIGWALDEAVPEMASAFQVAKKLYGRSRPTELTLNRADGSKSVIMLTITAEADPSDEAPSDPMRPRGFVLTFDDITELQAAQRTAAWADVARRIAHEIKNPLTPIQLSAERLKRKYLKEIESDKETFAACTDTIGRQVDDIRRMVDEFSSFARMPTPKMRDTRLGDLIKSAVFLQRQAAKGITFDTKLPDVDVVISADAQQINQVLINLLKNACEGIEARRSRDQQAFDAAISIILTEPSQETRKLVISDNGIGLPKQDRERLTEPYVTTRSKGTGLGLAIVKKIMEDHGGSLILDDAQGGGAMITLIFPMAEPVSGSETAQNHQ